jgi:hypothetical protein
LSDLKIVFQFISSKRLYTVGFSIFPTIIT